MFDVGFLIDRRRCEPLLAVSGIKAAAVDFWRDVLDRVDDRDRRDDRDVDVDDELCDVDREDDDEEEESSRRLLLR